jgi:hypothetical protein
MAAQFWYTGKDHIINLLIGRMALFNAIILQKYCTITGALPNILLPITLGAEFDRTDAPGVATRLRPNIKSNLEIQ